MGGRGTWPPATASGFCSKVRASDIPVLELEIPGSAARTAITQECARAVALDGCDVIVLGCAGMADLAVDISARIGVPVVDGVVAATTMVQSPVGMGLATSRRGEFARPIPKDVGGLLAGFALGEPAVSEPRVPVGFAAPPLAAPMVGAPGRILPGTAGNRCGRLQVSARRGTRHDRQVIAGPGYAHRRRLIGREGRCRSE